MQEELCNLKVHINGQYTFFLSKRIVCTFSGKMRKMIKHEKRRSQIKNSGLKIVDFPGGPEGFELGTRFCYNGGGIQVFPSNVCLLHCSAVALEMTEEISSCNLLAQTEAFLDGLFYWSWNDVLTSLKSCEPFLAAADSAGLLQRLVSSLLGKISANSELPPLTTATPLASSSSSSSSPDTSGFRYSSSTKTPETVKPCFSREWWFDDLTVLHPKIIEKVITTLGAYGSDNKNLILTRFLLHYLKTVAKRPGGFSGHGHGQGQGEELDYSGLADTAVYGVALMGRTAFSCRGLFWVLRVVSGLGLSRDCRDKLERLMGLVLDQATLDDLLVSGHDAAGGAVYDVNLVLRLVRVFVGAEEGGVPLQRMKKLGRLIDKYLGEISPDQNLKVSKFLGLAESLPDSARDCFDGVYRALDIYLESHPTLSFEERSRLCRCLNYEKLTLEACKDLAKNPRIPPRSAVQALASQKKSPSRVPKALLLHSNSSIPSRTEQHDAYVGALDDAASVSTWGVAHLVEAPAAEEEDEPSTVAASPAAGGGGELLDEEEKEELRLNLQRMQWRVVELEKVCREMKGQMSKMMVKGARSGGGSRVSSSHHHGRGLPRLC